MSRLTSSINNIKKTQLFHPPDKNTDAFISTSTPHDNILNGLPYRTTQTSPNLFVSRQNFPDPQVEANISPAKTSWGEAPETHINYVHLVMMSTYSWLLKHEMFLSIWHCFFRNQFNIISNQSVCSKINFRAIPGYYECEARWFFDAISSI